MEKLTPLDLVKLHELLKNKIPGIELRVMPNPIMTKGIGILLMHPDDMDDFKEIFQPLEKPKQQLQIFHDPDKCGCGNDSDYCPYNPNSIS